MYIATLQLTAVSLHHPFSSNSECINGTHTCFVNHTIDDNGQLSNSSLDSSKKQLIQVFNFFNFQFNHKEHLQVDIYKYPTHGKHMLTESILYDYKSSYLYFN